MNFAEKAVIMNASEMTRALKRMAHEIIEANKGVDNLVLLGVQRRGVSLARMLGGAKLTSTTRRHAKELLAQALKQRSA